MCICAHTARSIVAAKATACTVAGLRESGGSSFGKAWVAVAEAGRVSVSMKREKLNKPDVAQCIRGWLSANRARTGSGQRMAAAAAAADVCVKGDGWMGCRGGVGWVGRWEMVGRSHRHQRS